MRDTSASVSRYRAAVLVICLILVVAALYWTKSVLVPVVLSVLLAFVLSPLVTAAQRLGLGRVLAVLAVVVLACALVGVLSFGVLLQLRHLALDLPQHKETIVAKLVGLQEAGQDSWLDRFINTIRDIDRQVREATPRDAAPKDPVLVKVEASTDYYWSWFQTVVSPVLELLVQAGLVVILVGFMLFKREDLRDRLLRVWGNGRLTRTTQALDDASTRISRFLLMQLVVNGSYGLVFGIGLYFLGVPYALLWGFLAGVIRYIPYIGPWVGASLPLLLSVAVTPGWTQALLVLGFVLLLELLSNNVMEPLLYGQSIGVSEVALIVAAAFWTWLWGAMGLLLATPLTACLVVLGRHVPGLGFLGVLLGDQPALEPHASYYQRLLAHDQEEAEEIVEEYIKTHPAEQVYDDVLLPALVLARQGRERGDLDADDIAFLYRVVRDQLDDLDVLASGNGDGEAPPVLVLAYPAADEADELALLMLRQLLDPARCRFEVLGADTLSAEVVARVRADAPAAVCLAALPPRGTTRARYLCKRLRAAFPDLKLLVGSWGTKQDPERVRARLQPAGANLVGTTLLESRDQLTPLLPVLAEAEGERPVLQRA